MPHQSPGVPQAPAALGSPLPTIDPLDLFRFFRKRIAIVAIAFGVCVALALVYLLFLAPRVYESTAVVYIEPQSERVLKHAEVRDQDLSSLDALKSFERAATSSTVTLRVIDANGLRDDPAFVEPRPDGKAHTDAELVGLLRSRVTAVIPRGTRLLEVTVSDKDPEFARRLAQSFVDEFEGMLIDQNLEAAHRARESLLAESDRLRTRLAESEERLQAFREQHADLPLEDSQNIVEQKLHRFSAVQSEAKTGRLIAQSELEQLEALELGDYLGILEIGTHARQDHIAGLLLAISEKRAELASAGGRLTPNNPTWKALDSELENLEKSLRDAALAVGQNIRNKAAAALETEAKIKQTVDDQKAAVLALDDVRKQYRTFKREVEAERTMFTSLLERINETDLTQGVRASSIRQVDAPLVPIEPSGPSKKLVLAAAGIFGIGVGCAIVFLLYFLDRSVRGRRQVEQALGIPVLADLPVGEYRSLADSGVIVDQPRSIAADAFRDLHAAISCTSSGEPHTILVTSALPGEGKSYCALNLALLQAQLGRRTLLLDADVRRPALSQLLLGKPAVGPDLPDSSAETSGQPFAKLTSPCVETRYPNLSLFSCASLSNGSGEPVAARQFGLLLAEARANFDSIVIDSPPVGAVSDALAIAPHADVACLVVRERVSSIDTARDASRQLQQTGAPLAGCILNGVTEPSPARKAYYEAYGTDPAPLPAFQAVTQR